MVIKVNDIFPKKSVKLLFNSCLYSLVCLWFVCAEKLAAFLIQMNKVDFRLSLNNKNGNSVQLVYDFLLQ